MFTMDQIHHIRELFYEQDKNLTEIAEIVGCDWRTAKKYVDQEDFSPREPKPGEDKTHASKLDPYKSLIDRWLTEDKKTPRKHRHTAKRVYNRLVEEVSGFNASYRLVASYVAAKKKELRLNAKGKEGFIPLVHQPGEARADFGYADFYENGKYHEKGKYLVLSFPYSNGGYLQLNYGENLECLLEGLQTIFEYIGGVPTEIWFDNMGDEIIYSFDSEDECTCRKCKALIHIKGRIREYPIGAFCSENIVVDGQEVQRHE